MDYKLFNISDEPVNYEDLQNKSYWCKKGESIENKFVDLYGDRLKIKINPEKSTNPYTIDLLQYNRNILCDLKTQNTPFFKAHELYRTNPTYTIIFNHKDRERYYEKYRLIDLFFWIDWIAVKLIIGGIEYKVFPLSGVWKVSFKDLDDYCNERPLHNYSQRKDDQNGNAKGSYVLDIRNKIFEQLI